MELLADGLLILAATIAAIYCMVLSRRLSRLTRLDSGMGASIRALSQQADDLQSILVQARSASQETQRDLVDQTARAERAAGRLELLLATLHDSQAGTSKPVGARPETKADALRDVYKAMRS